MRKYIKYLVVVGVALSMQGCFSFTHNVEPVNINNIDDNRQLMVATQTFKCQNAFVGGAHKYLINKNDIYRTSKLPNGMEVSSYGELSGGVVDKKAIFLKHTELQGRDFGFLVYADGTFVYNRGKEQFGVVSPYGASNEFMFNVDCDHTGNKIFKPMTQNELNRAKGN